MIRLAVPHATKTMRIIPITPVAKPRMTRSDKWKQRDTVVRYRAYKDDLKVFWDSWHLELGMSDFVTFVLPMPSSWSKKKTIAMAFEPHTQRPDLDNLLKGLWDALLLEDAHMHRVFAQKIWGFDGSIILHSHKTLSMIADYVRDKWQSHPGSIPDQWIDTIPTRNEQ